MNEMGYKMNHSTARNIYVNALTKIAKQVTELYDIENDDKNLKKIAINPDFQSAVSTFMKV